MDWIKEYRYYLLWQVLFAVVGLVAAVVVFKKWKSLGGPKGYQAP